MCTRDSIVAFHTTNNKTAKISCVSLETALLGDYYYHELFLYNLIDWLFLTDGLSGFYYIYLLYIRGIYGQILNDSWTMHIKETKQAANKRNEVDYYWCILILRVWGETAEASGENFI